MPFKTVIKPKSVKSTIDENSDDEISSSAQKDQEKEENTEFVNLSQTQNEKLKYNQYQQIGQENNAVINQDNKVALNQQQALESQASSVDIINSSNSSAIQISGVQSGQGIDNINNASVNSALANSAEQIKAETAKKEAEAIQDNFVTETRGVTGQTQVAAAESFGVIGETEVTLAENFGVSGEAGVIVTENFGVSGEAGVAVAESFGATGEKIVLDSPKIGAKGDTSTSISNDPIKSINNYDQPNNLNDNIYRQVGPDGQIIPDSREEIPFNQSTVSDIENENINPNTTENNNSLNNVKGDTATENNNRLTFDKMSVADSALQSQNSEGETNQGLSSLDTNPNSSDKAIYGSLPQQEYGTQGNLSSTEVTAAQGNLYDNTNSTNLPSDQTLGAKGESVTTVTNYEGATGDKAVNVKEFPSAKGESGVTSREFLSTRGETSVNFSDTKGVSGTTLASGVYDNQLNKDQALSAGAKKIIINRAGADSNQNQNLNSIEGQATGSYSTSDSVSTNVNPDYRITTPSETIGISNLGQNARYEDMQTPGAEDQQRRQENNTKEPSQPRPVYRTITNDSGNTYQVDEYGNKINDSGNTYQVDEYGNKINDLDYSYEELQSGTNTTDGNTRSSRYSTIDGVRTNEQPDDGFPSNSIQRNNSDINYQPNQNNRTGGQSANSQGQTTYSPLTSNVNNASRLSKSDSKDSGQSGKNYNFIQKLSMTINRALGIEPQSVKDEKIDLINADENQEFAQGGGLTRVISPRITGLVESKDQEDEEEERKNKRKQLRYQRVGYTEPDFKAPEPTKLDDETQVFKDLYEDRNRFDYDTVETNSALLRRAEEEIEKQSETAKELNIQEAANSQNENNQDIESVYYIELLKERTRLEQALDDERESNRLAIRKSEDNIQQQLLDLILNGQNADFDSRSNDPISQLVQTLTDDKNKNSEQVVIDATKIVQMIQNQITESNGSPIDEFLLRKRIEDELKSEFVYMQREQEKKMKLVYRKMLEDMYMDMINN